MLDWLLTDAQEQIHRYVAEQSDAWQQSVAARTVDLATKQAALESGDADKVGFVALAAYDAEKALALKTGVPHEGSHTRMAAPPGAVLTRPPSIRRPGAIRSRR